MALVFVVLDVEVAFLYPWAVTYRELLAEYSAVILWDMIAFMALLAMAYFQGRKSTSPNSPISTMPERS